MRICFIPVLTTGISKASDVVCGFEIWLDDGLHATVLSFAQIYRIS
jgi:hypothetical protein